MKPSVCQYIASTKLRWVKEGEENSVDEVMKVAHEFVETMQVAKKIVQIMVCFQVPEAEEKKKAQGATERRKTISALVIDQVTTFRICH